MLGDRVRIDHDLRVVAPEAARPGEPLPVRAFLYGGLDAVEGARLVAGELVASLHTGPGAPAIDEIALVQGLSGSYEGQLRVPADVGEGKLRLRVRAGVGEHRMVAERAVKVGSRVAAPAVLPRSLRALQQLSPGPVRQLGDAPAPAALTPVVAGGACVPELPCRLYVHVGSPAAAVSLRAGGDVSPGEPEPVHETAGAVGLPLTTHGPEATARLLSQRAEAPVAQRPVRLPLALGSEALSLRGALPPVAGQAAALQISGEGPCIVDAYRDGRWVDTRSYADCSGELVSLRLSTGTWRLQVRRDPFSADSAAVVSFPVLAAGATPAALLSAAATAAAAAAPEDALAAQVRADPDAFVSEFGPTLGYLRALLEAGLRPLPAAVSGYDAALWRYAKRRERAGLLTVVALALSGLCLGLLVARRGLAASAQARGIMAQAGDTPDENRRRGLLLTLRVLAVMLAILLAFVVIALYVVARGAAH